MTVYHYREWSGCFFRGSNNELKELKDKNIKIDGKLFISESAQ
ncbi:MAG: hypothetical protein Ct9H90mP18_06620 [Gammaproteobacteria bacterium]|nr:MAG: hypothetical protein Ct9H90mP18_06620 [Gammaproteobacteria bacterium]